MARGFIPARLRSSPPKAQCDQHGTTRCLRSGRETSCPHSLCGSGLARESVGSACIRTECTPASKPTPTSNLGCSQILHPTQLPCGSLLAMTPAQPPPWRGSLLPLGCAAVAKPDNAVCLETCRGLLLRPAGASSLATGVSVEPNIHPNATHCGSRLELAKAAGQLASILNVPPSSRASPLPHRVVAEHSLCNSPIPCGSKLARESGGSACINVEHATLFASKPAPTPGGGRTQSLQQPRSPVGAKLARDEIDTVPDQNKSPKSPANPTPTEPAYTPSSSYASLRLCLQLRQNPPACAPCPWVLLSSCHCPSVVGFSSPR